MNQIIEYYTEYLYLKYFYSMCIIVKNALYERPRRKEFTSPIFNDINSLLHIFLRIFVESILYYNYVEKNKMLKIKRMLKMLLDLMAVI